MCEIIIVKSIQKCFQYSETRL